MFGLNDFQDTLNEGVEAGASALEAGQKVVEEAKRRAEEAKRRAAEEAKKFGKRLHDVIAPEEENSTKTPTSSPSQTDDKKEKDEKDTPTPLVKASKEGNIGEVNKLAPTASLEDKNKALMASLEANKNHIRMARTLMKEGADGASAFVQIFMTEKDKNKRSKACVRLLQAGLDPNEALAKMAGRMKDLGKGKELEEFMKRAAKAAGKDPKNVSLNQALIIAAKSNNTKAVQNLLAMGANPKTKDKDGKTAMSYAQKNGNEAITGLLDGNLDLNEQLLLAAKTGNSRQVEELLKKGANPNYQDKNGRTALMYAAATNDKNSCKVLLTNGANINQQDKNGRTALMYAGAKRRADSALYLIDSGANTEIKDNAGKRVDNYIVRNSKDEAPEEIAIGAIKSRLKHTRNKVANKKNPNAAHRLSQNSNGLPKQGRQATPKNVSERAS